jgi:hypothetical protein
VPERRHASSDVALTRRLEFDNLGAVIGEELGAVRPGDALGQVDDADAFERSGCRCLQDYRPFLLPGSAGREQLVNYAFEAG